MLFLSPLLFLQTFTRPQGSTDRIPLKNVDTKVSAIRISWVAPDNNQQNPSIETTVFGCMERKFTLQIKYSVVLLIIYWRKQEKRHYCFRYHF